jgi:hypothetical protein
MAYKVEPVKGSASSVLFVGAFYGILAIAWFWFWNDPVSLFKLLGLVALIWGGIKVNQLVQTDARVARRQRRLAEKAWAAHRQYEQYAAAYWGPVYHAPAPQPTNEEENDVEA